MKAEIECVVGLSKAGLNFRQIEELITCARALKRWDEAVCNGWVCEHDDGHCTDQNGRGVANRAERALKRAAEALAMAESTKSAGFGLRHQPDPRGCSLYVVLPQGTELPVWG